MPKRSTIIIVLLLLLATGGSVLLKRYGAVQKDQPTAIATVEALPRLLELGSTTCTPCQMMEKVLEELRHEYPKSLQVAFIDVTKEPDAGTTHNIRMIPTQILFAPDGKEIFRHEGFFSKDEILSAFASNGVTVKRAEDAAVVASTPAPGVMQTVFQSLSRWVEDGPVVALVAACIWGILSIVLSPCHLASIPLIIGFIDEQGRASTKRAFITSSLFSVGILITIALIGAITAMLGRMMGDVGAWGGWFVAIIFFVVGLHLLEVISLPFSGPGQVGLKRKGMLAAFILGLVFGIALGPCTFAYMAPMLAVTFRVASDAPLYAVALLAAYGIGHCGVIVLAGTSTEIVQRFLNWNEASKGAVLVKKACGVLVLLGGLYMVYKSA